MNHYIYYSYEEKGRGYIGSRSCKCEPEKDNYFGSFTDKTFKPNKKIILAKCNTKKERYFLEYMFQKMHNVVENPHFANKAFQTTTGFSRLGLKNSKESRRKMSESRKNRPSGMKGKKHSEETKKRISDSLKKGPPRNTANKWTDERRKKHSQVMTGRKGTKHSTITKELLREKLSKEITLKNINTGEVKTFSSQKQAARYIKTSQGGISNLFTSRAKQLKGWVIFSKDKNFLNNSS